MNIVDRFWAKVDKNGPIMPSMDTPCWVWTASTIKDGYGQYRIGLTTMVLSHRFSWELANGSIPEGLLVCHYCDNPPCIRPDHLFTGTQLDNNRDCWKKGRASRKFTTCDHSGSKNWLWHNPEKAPTSKINYEIAGQIRIMYSTGKYTQKELGAKFNLKRSAVGAITTGKSWK